MTVIARASAVSHVGRVRSNNQDSGMVGHHLFAVADGMGGHAGGDVASAIAVKFFAECDTEYAGIAEAEAGLSTMLIEANKLITDSVAEHPELRGMGTTASAIAFVQGKLVLAHIGDSRVYRLHDGVLTQETIDHTFVQRLVDAGRITPEEALTHPRRSVLMRVLGDVETPPEVDTTVLDAVSGDRWLLCSDGLSSYVEEEELLRVLARMELSSREVCDDLVQLALDNGAPDNVTAIVLELGDEPLEPLVPRIVGSASNPLKYKRKLERRTTNLSALLDPLRRTPPPRASDEEYVEPTDEFLEQLIADEKRRKHIRSFAWLVMVLIMLGAVVGAGALAYNWTQQQYYVGDHDGYVAIYQGVQQSLGPIELSHIVEVSDVRVEDLSLYQQSQIEGTISFTKLDDARDLVDRLRITSG